MASQLPTPSARIYSCILEASLQGITSHDASQQDAALTAYSYSMVPGILVIAQVCPLHAWAFVIVPELRNSLSIIVMPGQTWTADLDCIGIGRIMLQVPAAMLAPEMTDVREGCHDVVHAPAALQLPHP